MVACFLCESVYICSDGDDMKKGFKGLEQLHQWL